MRSLSPRSLGVAVALVGLLAVPPAGAAVFTGGDILVSSTTNLSTNVLREYTPTGTLVQTFSVPVAPGGDAYARDIAVDGTGKAQIYNGTFTPALTTLDPTGAGTFTNHNGVGFSTVNNLNYGGIAVAGNFAYVTDMSTAGSPDNGIVRFNLTDFSSVRFAGNTGPGDINGDKISLNVGLNGLIYGLSPGGSPAGYVITEYDPNSLSLLKTITLANRLELRGIAADQSGNIYGVGALGDGNIYKFDSSGNLLATQATGFIDLNGLQLSNSGQLLTATNTGRVILSNTSFSSLSSFSVGNQLTTFAAFTTTPLISSVPEPSAYALAGAFGAAGLVGAWRRKRASA